MQAPPISKMPVQTLTPQAQVQPQYEITEADRKRQQAIQAAWKAYNGELDAPLRKMPGEADDNVLSNRCQPIIDRGVDFLFGKEIEISVEEGAPQEAQDILDKIWGRKEARIPLLQKLGMNGGIAGEAFLRIVPGNDGSFRLVVVDPSTVFVKTAPQDCETVLLYCIEYCTDERRNGQPVRVSYREEMARIDPSSDDNEEYEDINADGIDADVTWSIQHWTRIGERGAWTPAGEPIMWPYPFSPIFSCQNLPSPNDFWGKPDITPDLIGVNNALNLVQSCVNRINKLYGSPIIYSTGMGDGDIAVNPGRIIQLPLAESKIVAVNIMSDIPNALKFAEDLRSDIDEQSSVPGVATGRITAMPRGQLSGIAVELLFQPLLLKTNKKRCSYGELLIDISKALLVLNKMNGDIDITLAWQNPLPEDDLPAIQASVLLKQVGVSDTTIQRNLGYDPDEELVLNQAENAQKLQAFNQGQGMPVIPGQAPNTPPAQQQESPFMVRGQ